MITVVSALFASLISFAGTTTTALSGTTTGFLTLTSWTSSNFSYDTSNVTGFCTGQRFIKNVNKLGIAWIGVICCNADCTEYSIFGSSTQTGTYYPLGDSSGSGEDHCEMVNCASQCTVKNYCGYQCQATVNGWGRANWGESFVFGAFNPGNKYFGRSYTGCQPN
ncbi:MAG: hypothetical protein RJB66_1756 [Pseudomonadota bacterium]|jgi:hypothetical protein